MCMCTYEFVGMCVWGGYLADLQLRQCWTHSRFIVKPRTNRALFETLQEKTEKSTPNDEYENFVNANLEAAARYIPAKIIESHGKP